MGAMSNLLFVSLLILQLNYGLAADEDCVCVEPPVPFGSISLTRNTFIIIGRTVTATSTAISTRTWYDANIDCRNMGYPLLKLETETDLARLLDNFDDNTPVWVGLTRESKTSNWIWSDGSTFDSSSSLYSFLNQRPNEPSCAYAVQIGDVRSLQGTACEAEFAYVCEYDVNGVPQPLTSYIFYSTSWSYAVWYSQSLGGAMAMFKTEEEFNQLITDSRITAYTYIWVGLQDIDGDGTFTYIDGTPFTDTSYATWADGVVVNEQAPDRVVYINLTDNLWYITRTTSQSFTAYFFTMFDRYCA